MQQNNIVLPVVLRLLGIPKVCIKRVMFDTNKLSFSRITDQGTHSLQRTSEIIFSLSVSRSRAYQTDCPSLHFD
jgi:hypothetical protein